ncbi:MAG: EAL domain-containing protein [Gammaproteobacteria bacterium]|nr:EAL domain-containing protein [Gammaproteobacteria bacterium]
MTLSQLELAYDRNELGEKIEDLLNYDENLNSALILINVWHTRQISAHHGYDVSQDILALIAEELQPFVKENCILLKTGNHEFALLIQNIKNPGHCQLALNKIIRELHNKPISIRNFRTQTKISSAAALYPEHAVTVQNLIQCAEIALFRAEDKNVPSLMYSRKMSQLISKKLQIESELDEAIQAKELQVWYQPKIDFMSGEIYGVEALCRWQSKHNGFISPEIFIPLAEERNFIFDLTRWMLNTAFRKQKEWHAMGLEINMAVNISGNVIDDDEFVDLIEHSCGIWETRPKNITLEVTETAMMQSMDENLGKLKILRDHGFILSIDDFGTGYSSLEYFKNLPVHEVKIDKSFVINMIKNKSDRSLVNMMVDLAKNFSLTTVAEGIEDDQTYKTLKMLGVDRAQGFHIAKPMPEEEFLTWAEFYITNLNT